jgi:hypothetical protein
MLKSADKTLLKGLQNLKIFNTFCGSMYRNMRSMYREIAECHVLFARII